MKTFTINPKDNVSVMLDGEKKGHKIALRDILQEEKIIKYGFPIGIASKNIKKGEWVHSHNLVTGLNQTLEYTYMPISGKKAENPINNDVFFGFARADGNAGIRNEIWILPTVGCISKTAEIIANKAQKKYLFSNEKGCGGIYAFPHPYGCSQLGDDLKNTQKILAGLAQNPNVGGVLILGLGCENNRIEELYPLLTGIETERIKFIECQQTDDEIEAGLRLIDALYYALSNDIRTAQPVSKLTVGLKCGGSDGFSGITANPLCGVFADKLIAGGGRIILTEVPEMFGAEIPLMNRCENKKVFNKTVNMINRFKEYYRANNQPIYENPSPGNKDGGITTLEEKSLGCVTKSGESAVRDVLEYGERVKTNGLSLLNGPGNDLVASTALAASGAQIVLFTTGRGTPFGCAVPTLKISTNTNLSEKKIGWIDFDAGRLLGGLSMAELKTELYNLVVNVANGEILTQSEQNGYRDIAIFKTGVTL